MDSSERISWLVLHRLTGGWPVMGELIAHFGSASAVFQAPHRELTAQLGERAELIDAIRAGAGEEQAARELGWLKDSRNHVITLVDRDYPEWLRTIADPPALLYVRGDPSLLVRPQLAIVGSRNPTPMGCENAQAFAAALSRSGFVITSGMALGIDACAHRGALDADGATIAVTGTGVDRVYPAQHHALAHAIAQGGALVSEFPLGSAPRREHFPRRNRIISGLSVGVLVVEAALKSGSLISARLAAEQGREVFALPGSIHSPLSRGCHALIRQGAKLVESAEDILEELGTLVRGLRESTAVSRAVSNQEQAPRSELEGPMQRLEACMGFDPVDIDTLVERSGLTPEVVSSMLLQLELRGRVTSGTDGKFQRASVNA